MDPKPIQPAPRGSLAPACPALDIVRFLECGGNPPSEVKLPWPDWAQVSDEQALKLVVDWSQSVLALAGASPAAQFEKLAPGLTQWAGNLRRHQLAELVATLAVAYIAKTGLFANMNPPYATANDFLADFLAKSGRSADAPAISKLRTTAEFWWEILAAGFPVPLKLSTLEPLSHQVNRLLHYRTLVAEAGGQVPEPWRIRAYLERIGVFAESGRPERAYSLCRLLDDGRRIVKTLPAPVADELKALFDKIELHERPKFKGRRRAKPQPFLWQPDWAEPFQLTLRPDRHTVRIGVDETHLPLPVRSAVWTRAHEDGWAELVNRQGWEVPLCDFDADRLNHELGELEEFFTRQCARLGAPLPVWKQEAA